MKKKVCIVVDHPDRDLDGILYLINILKQDNFTYFLVPFYNFREIYLIKPHVVILNHSRWIYSNLIKILHSLGITILVQDTEGGMVTTHLIKEYISYNDLENNLKYIKAYLIWSKKIKIELTKYLKNANPSKLIVHGNPRFNLMKELRSNLGKNLLINLNFATINPKFNSVQKEKDALKSLKKTEKWIEEYSKQQYLMQKEFMKLIKFLSKSFKNLNIHIRPHPYENDQYYKKKLSEHKNITVSHNKNLKEDINNSFLIIQNNCGTAVDANLLGRPVIYYSPFKSKLLDQKFISEISIITKSLKETKDKVDFYINKKNINNNKQLDKINYSFCFLNGQFLDVKRFITQSKDFNHSLLEYIYLIIKNNEIKYFLKTIFKLIIGLNTILKFKRNFRTKLTSNKMIKNFNLKYKKINLIKKKLKPSKVKIGVLNLFTIKIN